MCPFDRGIDSFFFIHRNNWDTTFSYSIFLTCVGVQVIIFDATTGHNHDGKIQHTTKNRQCRLWKQELVFSMNDATAKTSTIVSHTALQ